MRKLLGTVVAAGMLLVPTTALAGQIGQSRNVLDLDGNKMRVTLVAFVPSFTGYDRTFDAPKAGMRYVGIRFRVQNLSNHKIDECDDNDVQLATRSGLNIGQDATITQSTACYNLLPHRIIYAWTYQFVPKAAKVAILDFIPDSQNSDSVAEWKL